MNSDCRTLAAAATFTDSNRCFGINGVSLG
jgi:hypothetical protein